MTDDQTLSDMQMPLTRSLIGEQGATFVNSFVNYPLCCPSRATFVTGQNAHNHGVESGNGYSDLDHTNTLPVWLEEAGYGTAHIGKYINGYSRLDRDEVPAGWSEWYGALRPELDVYDYDLNENGAQVHYGSSEADFKGDVITAKALDFIERRAPEPAPFFLSVGYVAPHYTGAEGSCVDGPEPAPRHLGLFAAATSPQPPNFDEADISDKHSQLRGLPPLPQVTKDRLERRYRCRQESLQHVDEGVAQMVAALRDAGTLQNTLLIFTSDNGYFMGEHRIATGKLRAYDESIRVPLLIRGPGVPAGIEVEDTAINVDLAATIVAAAGATPGLTLDGLDLVSLIGGERYDRDVLIENRTAVVMPYFGLRTPRYTYVAYDSGEVELFDNSNDPFQLESVHDDPRYAPVMAWAAERLDELRTCAGATCSQPAEEPPLADFTPPQTVIDTHPPDPDKARSPSFAFSADEAGSSFECETDNGGFAACASPQALADLAEGTHSFRVRAIDPVGNIDPTPAEYTWEVDATAPEEPTLGSTDPVSPANDNDPLVRGGAAPGSTITVYADAACSGPAAAAGTAADFTDPGLAVTVADDQTTTFHATATDAAGNASPCSTTPIDYVEDSTPPETSVDTGPEGTGADPSPSFAFSADEAGSSFECRLDSEPLASCASPEGYADLADGPHTFAVAATDGAGNTDPSAAERAFTLDTIADGTAWARKLQKQNGNGIVVKVNVKAGEDLTAAAGGRFRISNSAFRLVPQTTMLASGEISKLRLKLDGSPQRRKIRNALAQDKWAKVRLLVQLTDAVGNGKTLKLG